MQCTTHQHYHTTLMHTCMHTHAHHTPSFSMHKLSARMNTMAMATATPPPTPKTIPTTPTALIVSADGCSASGPSEEELDSYSFPVEEEPVTVSEPHSSVQSKDQLLYCWSVCQLIIVSGDQPYTVCQSAMLTYNIIYTCKYVK